jgi:hypothetical protein
MLADCETAANITELLTSWSLQSFREDNYLTGFNGVLSVMLLGLQGTP